MSDDSAKDLWLAEWQACRTVLSQYDGYLDGLRKYGFTFLVGLFTATSLVGQITTPLGGTTIIPIIVKFAIFSSAVLLVVGLFLLDNIYRSYQKATNFRIHILETRLNLELTETINDNKKEDNIERALNLVYGFFLLAAFAIGFFSLYPNWTEIEGLIVVLIGGVIFFIFIWKVFRVHSSWADWTIDKIVCKQGDRVRITLTNLGSKILDLTTNVWAWKVLSEEDYYRGESFLYVKDGKNFVGGQLEHGDSYDWQWEITPAIQPGIYVIITNSLEKVGIISPHWQWSEKTKTAIEDRKLPKASNEKKTKLTFLVSSILQRKKKETKITALQRKVVVISTRSLQIQSIANGGTGGPLTVYVQNVGQTTVTLASGTVVYINGAAPATGTVTVTPSNGVLTAGSTAIIAIANAGVPAGSSALTIKVQATDGSTAQTTFYP